MPNRHYGLRIGMKVKARKDTECHSYFRNCELVITGTSGSIGVYTPKRGRTAHTDMSQVKALKKKDEKTGLDIYQFTEMMVDKRMMLKSGGIDIRSVYGSDPLNNNPERKFYDISKHTTPQPTRTSKEKFMDILDKHYLVDRLIINYEGENVGGLIYQVNNQNLIIHHLDYFPGLSQTKNIQQNMLRFLTGYAYLNDADCRYEVWEGHQTVDAMRKAGFEISGVRKEAFPNGDSKLLLTKKTKKDEAIECIEEIIGEKISEKKKKEEEKSKIDQDRKRRERRDPESTLERALWEGEGDETYEEFMNRVRNEEERS